MTRVVVAMTGASGAAIGVRVLELLRTLPGIETHLVLSAAAERTLAQEVGVGAAERARKLAHVATALNSG